MVITKGKVAEYFGFSFNYDLIDLVVEIVGMIENEMDEEGIYEEIDRGLTYTKDQWTILMYYCSPTKANFDEAYEQFCSDIFAIVEGVKNENQSK